MSLTFDSVGQLDELRPLLGEHLDVVPGRRVVGQVQQPREAVQAVAHGDVDRLAEDAVPATTNEMGEK